MKVWIAAFAVVLMGLFVLPISVVLADPGNGNGGGQDNGNGGVQGNAGSNPDSAGVDKPFDAAGQTAGSEGSGHDGNNGCGQEKQLGLSGGDDNNGNCGNPNPSSGGGGPLSNPSTPPQSGGPGSGDGAPPSVPPPPSSDGPRPAAPNDPVTEFVPAPETGPEVQPNVLVSEVSSTTFVAPRQAVAGEVRALPKTGSAGGPGRETGTATWLLLISGLAVAGTGTRFLLRER